MTLCSVVDWGIASSYIDVLVWLEWTTKRPLDMAFSLPSGIQHWITVRTQSNLILSTLLSCWLCHSQIEYEFYFILLSRPGHAFWSPLFSVAAFNYLTDAYEHYASSAQGEWFTHDQICLLTSSQLHSPWYWTYARTIVQFYVTTCWLIEHFSVAFTLSSQTGCIGGSDIRRLHRF